MAAPNISSDGLQIAQPETYPEAVHRLSTNNDTKLPQFHDHSHQEIAQTRGRRSYERSFFEPGPRSVQSEFGPNIEVPVDVWKKVFHDRRRKFWWIVVLSIVIVGALIGGSIGGALFVQNKADESTATATAVSSAAAATNQAASPASTSTSSSALTPSSSGDDQDNGATYTARPFGAIQSINTTCPSTLLISSQLEGKTSDISGRYRYSCLDNTNIPDLPYLMSFTAYTLEQCVDACSQYSAMSDGTNATCKAAIINAEFSQRYVNENGANCWLKSGAGDAKIGQTGYTAAVLQES